MIPSQSNRTLTLEGLVALVEYDVELARQRKRNLCSSIRKFSGIVNGTLQLQATFPVFRDLIGKADIAAAGITPSRWSNVRSDVTFALRRHGATTRAPLRKDLQPEWAAMMEMFDGAAPKFRRGLSSFIHFCNSNAMVPTAVNDDAFDGFLDHLTHTTMKNDPAKAHKQACKLWNECGERFDPWPGGKVEVPSYRRRISFPWDAFPASFRTDLSAYVRFMGEDDPTGEHCIGSPRKPTTLAHHREQIHRWASALVRDGYDINGITGLSVLVCAGNFKRAVRYLHEEWSGRKTAGLFEMASTMVVVAQEYVVIEGDDLHKLKKSVIGSNAAGEA